MKNVILFGKGTLSIQIAKWFKNNGEYDLSLIVPHIPEPTWTDSLTKWALKNKIPIMESGDFRDIPDTLEIDLAFSVYYNKIFDEKFINRCKRILNLHNAPLPKYRGVSPINWALKNNEPMHGVTIHEITPRIDDGDIVAQVKFSIYPEFEEVKNIYDKCLLAGYKLFEDMMPNLDTITPMPQNHQLATCYKPLENSKLKERSTWTREEWSKPYIKQDIDLGELKFIDTAIRYIELAREALTNQFNSKSENNMFRVHGDLFKIHDDLDDITKSLKAEYRFLKQHS